MKYRPEIDGLRSIAVLPVVLYHFSVPGFSGGFVGVDIFFVISGFLIGSILWAECHDTGRISLVNFYVRRFRRLAPAYFAMCLATGVVAYAILLPFEFYEFGKSLIAATAYLSNVFFYMGAGYFDSAAEEKFLLHTWSLAVEEQFYVFLPLFLLLLGGHRRRTLVLSWILAAVSLVACIAITYRDHNATFYLFPFRAWELFAGVLLAMHIAGRDRPLALGAWVSWAGMALLAGSILLIPAGTDFPGALAIAPVLGTVLVLANGQEDNPVNRLLSTRSAVFIGLISYSLYIWHWPVATLSIYYRGAYSGVPELLFWLGLTFVISWLSWRYVETPFRRGRMVVPWRVFGTVAVGSAALMAYGAVIYLGKGLPDRFQPEIRAHIDASQDFFQAQDYSRCEVRRGGAFDGLEICRIGPEGPEPSFIAWGDSHLWAFHAGLDLAAREADRPGWMIWRAGCPPLFGISKVESTATVEENESCSEANVQIRRAIGGMDTVSDLLLVGRWSYYATGTGTGRDADIGVELQHRNGTGMLSGTAAYDRAVVETVAELTGQGIEVFVLRQVPEIAFYDSREVSRRMVHGRLQPGPDLDALTDITLDDARARARAAEAPFQPLAAADRITWLDPWPDFCTGARCSAVRDGRVFYFDNNHITNEGARASRHVFKQALHR